PRVQIIVLALILFIVFPLAGMLYYSLGLLIFFSLAAVILYQATHIISYTFLVKKQVVDSKVTEKTQTNFSLIIANILMNNQKTEYLITLIKKHKPDFVLLIETNAWWLNKLQALESIDQHQFKFPAENTYGMTIFSKYKLINPQIYFMVEKDVP